MGNSMQQETGVRVIGVWSRNHPAANHKALNEGRGIPSGMRSAMRSAITPRPTTKA